MQKCRGLFIFLGFSLFLGSCGGDIGNLDTVFESQGSYRVNALVDNEYTLDNYSIINQNSKIRPFFVNSVVNDPDVRGLTVFVQDLSETVVSRKVHYLLAADGQVPGEAPDPLGTSPTDGSSGTTQAAEKSAADEDSAGGEDAGGAEDSLQDGYSGNAPENLTGDTAEDTSPTAQNSDKTDSATVEGNKQTAGLPVLEDQVLVVKQLDQYLSTFQVFENLKIGRYNLVFQVIGEKAVLYTAFKPIYFLGDADFTLGEIQSYLPGIPSGGRLIPPRTNVVLETEVSADSRLDPFVIWYSGKKILAQGRVSAGAQYLLWKTPEQTGFHTIRVEVFPLLPEERVPENISGKIKEMSLAISSKSSEPDAQGMRHAAAPSDNFINWYRFRGNLDDTMASNNTERQLIPLLAQKPRWIPFAGIYGLFVGPDDGYALPGKPFVLSDGEQGRARIYCRFAPLSTGTIFNVRFATKDGLSGAAVLDLSLEGGNLILRLSSEASSSLNAESWQESLALTAGETETFISAVITIEITPNRLGASLVLENPSRETTLLSIAVPKPLNGEAVIRFGGTEQAAGSKRDSIGLALDENGKPRNGTAIFNELALSYEKEIPGEPSLSVR
jgi:hypothetical protein